MKSCGRTIHEKSTTSVDELTKHELQFEHERWSRRLCTSLTNLIGSLSCQAASLNKHSFRTLEWRSALSCETSTVYGRQVRTSTEVQGCFSGPKRFSYTSTPAIMDESPLGAGFGLKILNPASVDENSAKSIDLKEFVPKLPRVISGLLSDD